jgi:hypothetical protein
VLIQAVAVAVAVMEITVVVGYKHKVVQVAQVL